MGAISCRLQSASESQCDERRPSSPARRSKRAVDHCSAHWMPPLPTNARMSRRMIGGSGTDGTSAAMTVELVQRTPFGKRAGKRAGQIAEVWRPRPESNRGARICSPLRNHSATWPIHFRRANTQGKRRVSYGWGPAKYAGSVHNGRHTGAGRQVPSRTPSHYAKLSRRPHASA